MAAPALSVEGGRQLRASLKRAGVDVQDLKAAHKQVADQVRSDALPVAPRRTGRLAASLRSSGTQREALVRAGRKAVPYGGPIHWGWPSRHIAAQPFIYDTAQRTEPTWASTYMAALEAIVQSIEGDPHPS
jgi:hypothetical protein